MDSAMDVETDVGEIEPWTRLDGKGETWNRRALKAILVKMVSSRKVSAKIEGGRTVSLFVFYAGREIGIGIGVPGPRVVEVDTMRESPPGSKDAGIWLKNDAAGETSEIGLLASSPGHWAVEVGVRPRFFRPLLYLTTAVKLPWFSTFSNIKGFERFEPDHLLVARNASISGPPFREFPLTGKRGAFPEDDPRSVHVSSGTVGGVLLAPAAWIAKFLVSSRRSFPRRDEIMVAQVDGLTIEMSDVSVYYTGMESNSQIMPKQFVFMRFDSPSEEIAQLFDQETESDARSGTETQKFSTATGELAPRVARAKHRESEAARALLESVVSRLPAEGPEAWAEANRIFFETKDADISSQARKALSIEEEAPRYFIASRKMRAAKESVRNLAGGASGEKKEELLEFAKILETEEDRARREFQRRDVLVD